MSIPTTRRRTFGVARPSRAYATCPIPIARYFICKAICGITNASAPTPSVPNPRCGVRRDVRRRDVLGRNLRPRTQCRHRLYGRFLRDRPSAARTNTPIPSICCWTACRSRRLIPIPAIQEGTNGQGFPLVASARGAPTYFTMSVDHPYAASSDPTNLLAKGTYMGQTITKSVVLITSLTIVDGFGDVGGRSVQQMVG